MSVTSKFFVSGLCFAFSAHLAVAADPDVIVTATRTAQTFDDTLSPVIVIGRDELENEIGAEIVDILHRYPGIDISRNGGPGQQSSIFIRGAESDHTLVMVDGVKINPGTIGIASVQNIPLEMIERIEIVKGPRSTLYGSDAIGGVINIITKRAKDTSRYTAAVGGGSFNTRELNLGAHHRQDNKSAGINVTGRASDGFPTRTTSNIDRGYDNVNVQLYGRMQRGDTEYDISYWHSQGNVEYLGFSLNPLDQDFRNTNATLGAKTIINSIWVSHLKLSHITDEIDQSQGEDFANTARYAIDWQNDIQLNDKNLFSTGLYLSDEHTTARSFGTRFDVDTLVGAVFAQIQSQYNAHQFIAGRRFTAHETAGDKATWNLEYGYQLSRQIKIIAAANTGFRSPSSTDRFGFGGNINLKPEESTNREIGLRYRQDSHAFTINAFDNQIDDLILYVDPDGSGPTPGRNQNIEETRIKGIEVSYQYSLENWLFALSAVDQNPQNITDNTQLLRRPEQKYNLSVAQKGINHKVQLDITHVSERLDFGSVRLDAYTLVGLKGNYHFTREFQASARIENLTDEKYALANGFNTPERSAYLELRYAY